ncbi:MAG: chorismate-binding protein, partial [Acidimicrobiia bacterium]|nr:chorismate-binding protein [Acidimicrobiia bacterium]
MAAYAWSVATVRFDDLTPGAEHSLELAGLVAELVAHDLDDVVAVVRDAQQAAVRGLWVGGFVSYEAAPAFDMALSTRSPTRALPLAWFGVFEDGVPVRPPGRGGAYELDGWRPSVDAVRFGHAVASIRRRIAAGDTYQLNYTFRLHSRFTGDSVAFYADLVAAQRGGYGAYLDTGDLVVASASPELFFDLSHGHLTTRPMKGTAPRGRWAEDDAGQAATLASSEKDLAENLIIVDLLRNDLGRVSEFGSVDVESLFQLECYETVWQMTSTITSRIRPDVEIVDVFRALFPCGSVTGAPKPRTMEIIADLEDAPRGVYCGAIGFIEPGGGRAVFSVPIRTVT